MRHKIAGRKLSRTSAHREALIENLVTSLFRHERIRTTVAKAKEARRAAEKMITLAKKNSLHARRLASATVRDKEVLRKLFGPLAERFADRPGGYTRIVRAGRRAGDAAEMAYLELVDAPEPVTKAGTEQEPASE
ncbi:MAG UNVERIFIED_CONTAM: 50S ribosomal protein L17 [Thermobifida fusca]